MHTYLNFKKMAEVSEKAWAAANAYGLLNISAQHIGNGLMETPSGHKFINMISCSYLGLDLHPKIIEGAINELQKMRSLEIAGSRVRVQLNALAETEQTLSELFSQPAMVGASCSTISQHILPIIACGALTNGQSPVMIFDKEAHFSLNINKAVCADETTVLTSPHNDMHFVEDCCKKNSVVAYIADGAYSMGGHLPMKDLLALQEKYGLFLFIDDSHSLSAYGKDGCGYAKSFIEVMPERTIIVATLSKGFGVCGGMALMSSNTQANKIKYFTGPVLWSQSINSAGFGGIIASAAIHKTAELITLQDKLQENIRYFDQLMDAKFKGLPLPIRLIILNEPERALMCSKEIFKRGFYTSAVFFPIVPKDRAALRIMIRANMSKETILQFSKVLTEVLEQR